ncbi:MAG TPA: hypothetical protein VGQ41_16665 [Pyrinomonadaceae bacterium]|jgi:hypothetical protein|nr:hypothetical protein [Pyrinomonadaceae bacterium]
MPIKAVPVTDSTPELCKGFTLEIKVVPKKDLRLHVIIDKTCVNNQAVWGLIFELDRKIDGQWTQVVFVSYKPKIEDLQAQQGIQKMLADKKVTKNQQQLIKDEVIPPTAELEGTSGPTQAQAKRIEAGARKVVVAEIGG